MDETVRDFVRENSDLPIMLPGINIQFRVGESGKLRMSLEIGLNTSQGNIRDCWYVISEWQRRLTAYQGAWVSKSKRAVYDRLLEEKSSGKSYRELANSLNEQIEDIVRAFLAARKEIVGTEPSLEVALGPGNRILGIQKAIKLLEAMVPSVNTRDLLNQVILDVENGKSPWPISREDVRSRLRNWKDKLD